MQAAIDTLKQMGHSAAWLGRHLKPPVRRQTICGWPDVPEHYIDQVARLLQAETAAIRPDLAALFQKPCKRAA